MKPINNILVPIDFTETSVHALVQAINLAKKSNAKLILFHAFHRPMVPVEAEKDIEVSFLEKRKKSINAKFEKLLEEQPELTKTPHEFHKELGVSIDCILNAIDKFNIDFILMGTKGAHGFEAIWGSKAAKVAKSAKCPVLVIPDNTEIGQIKKIGIA
ncbi:MAG: universal stress protein, partial [Bacteroidota bacterium]